MHRALVSFLLAYAGLAPIASAQVPDGAYVTSSFQVGSFGGPAGIYIVDPGQGSVTPVTNLPPEINGVAWPGSVVFGTDFVLRRPSDGALVTNGFGSGVTNAQMPVLILTLSGSAVTTSTRYDVGTVTSNASRGIPQAHVLADDRIVIAVDAIGAIGEPLAGAILGVVDPNAGPPGTPGTVAPIPVSPLPPGGVNGMALDLDAGSVYLGMIRTGMPSEVYRVPFPAGGSPQLVTTIAETITNMAIDNDGDVLVTCSGSGGLYEVDPVAVTATRLAPAVNNLNGVTVERATGDVIVATGAPGPVILRIDSVGNSTQVSPGPTGGWGTLVGVDVNHDPETFGVATPGANSYAWAIAPNAAGLPTLGNGSFGLEVTATPSAPLVTGVVASLRPAATPLLIFGMQVVLDPARVIASLSGPGAVTFQVPLPVPNIANLVGLKLYFQSFHLEPGNAFASSNGVALTILP